MAWTECETLGFQTDNSKYPVAIFVNTVDGVAANNARGAYYGYWNTLDLVNGHDPVSGNPFNAPPGIKAVFLSGILIITMGGASEIADLALTFRAPGSTLAGRDNRIMQTCFQAIPGAGACGGQRSNAAAWVPCVGGKLEWFWWVNNEVPYNYPANASYGVNLSLQGYAR